jgi:Protein of unknown function (DUF3810)
VIRRTLVTAAAVAAALIPTPPRWVEHAYSSSFYLSVQNWLTAATNRVPIALLDAAAVALAGGLLWRLVKRIRESDRGPLRRLGGVLFEIVATAAVVYLLFLLIWGLNYRREPLTARLDHDSARVTPNALERLAQDGVVQLNALWRTAHSRPWPDLESMPATLGSAFQEAQRSVGLSCLAVPGRPKHTLLEWYFQRAAIDGMTDPFFLEVLINHDVLPFERPSIVAHEWAHLAGFAHEAEAGFLGWVTTTRGDEQARYSGWLTVFSYSAGSLDDEPRTRIVRTLEPRVREDLRAMSERVRRSAPALRAAALAAYDRFLRANRVPSGVRSYEELVVLIAGTRFDAAGRPVRRPSGAP